ncbi:phosphatase PAP2 family protein [Patescibacteria group bacterium]|nr:phosphatase PAP2 family protein [Patescibacteria group bacterium]
MIKKAIYFLLFCIILISIIGSLLAILRNYKVYRLTFTSTQTWDPYLVFLHNETIHYIPDWQHHISIDPPPSNTAAQTKQELKDLMFLQNTRTPEDIQNILKEMYLPSMKFGDYFYGDYLDAIKFPKTSLLLHQAYSDLDTIILQLKSKYDRVRPIYLKSSLNPAIKVPDHPAYPSAHSTEAFFLAYVLSELAPDRKYEFESRAWEIAVNRERAGVHYRSDTEGGKSLASQYVTILLKNAEFKTLLEDAKSEWN